MLTPRLLLFALVALLAIIDIPALVHPGRFRKAAKDFIKSDSNIRISGFFSLIIGFLFLSVYWKFSEGWMSLISALGWLAVLKGIIRICFPSYCRKTLKNTILDSEKSVAVTAFLVVLFGIFLCYAAFNLIGTYEIAGA